MAKEVTQYHPDPDGQLRDVDELRDLAHELAVNFHMLLQHPGVRMVMNPMILMVSEVGVKLAHDMVCDAEAKEPEKPKTPLNIPGLEDLSDLFKDL